MDGESRERGALAQAVDQRHRRGHEAGRGLLEKRGLRSYGRMARYGWFLIGAYVSILLWATLGLVVVELQGRANIEAGWRNVRTVSEWPSR